VTLALDGTATGQMESGVVLTTDPLTTSHTNDVIVVCAGCETTIGPAPAISSVTATGLTFTLRKVFSNGSLQSQEEWYAIATATFSGVITVTYATSVDDAAAVAFAVNGADVASPWDGNTSMPTTSAGALHAVISTTSPDAFVFCFAANPFGNAASAPFPSPSALVASRLNNGGVNFEFIYVAGAVVSTSQAAVDWGFGTGDAPGTYIIIDAIVASPPPPPVAGHFGQLYGAAIDGVSIANWLLAYEQTVLKEDCYAEIWSGMSPDSSGAFNNVLLVGGLKVTGGTVTIDRNNAIRRSATNVTLLPDAGGVLLPVVGGGGDYAPFGQEMRIFKGYNDGTGSHYAKLGTFLISDVDVVNDATGVTLVGTMYDRGEWVARRGFVAPLQVGYVDGDMTTYTTDQVIGLLLLFCCGTTALPFTYTVNPSIVFNVPSSQTYNINQDPWAACQSLAAAEACQLYFDYNGDLQLTVIPSSTDPILPVTVGSCATYDEGTIVAPTSIHRLLSNTNIPNVIVATSQGSNVLSPQQCFWWESDATLKTYYAPPPPSHWLLPVFTLPPLASGSSYPMNVRSLNQSVFNDPVGYQANIMAFRAGTLATGSLEQTTITLRDQPAHDIDDVVTLRRVVAGITTLTDYVVDHVQIALDPVTPAQLTCRVKS